MTIALQIIRMEHVRIVRLVDLIKHIRQKMLDENTPPDTILLESVFHYIESYVDRVHHPKEDDYLFDKIQLRTNEVDDYITVLKRQHVGDVGLLARMREAIKHCEADFSTGKDVIAKALNDFAKYQLDHMTLEETHIMPLAKRVLTDEDWVEINTAFSDNEDPLFGEAVREEFQALFNEIVRFAPEPVGLGEVRVKTEPVNKPDTKQDVILKISSLDSHYGRIQALHGIDLEVREGELVSLVGANGAGKSTMMMTISGLQPASSGSISFLGQDITKVAPEKRVGMGIAQVPEGRQVFGPMSVEDNLLMGAYSRKDTSGLADDYEHMYELFPILKEKRKLAAGTLSGGQQQMLAIARALMSRPKLLLLDEPSMGLAPLLVEEVFNIISRLKKEGMTIFLVEQNALGALAISDRGYVIETGNIVLTDSGKNLLENDDVRAAYLGM